MGAVLSGCQQIIVIDPVTARRETALDLGATHALPTSDPGLVDELLSLTKGGADFSVECSGVPSAVNAAVMCLARPGWCAQVGATPGGTIHPLDMDHVGFGRGIKGVVMGDANPQTFVPYLAALHAQGKLPYERFVKFYDFADINIAIADSKSGDVIKPILRIS
jgi:aryl-alcohol dehydrogenase